MTDEPTKLRENADLKRQLKALEKRLETAQKQAEQVKPLEAEVKRQAGLLQEWNTWAEDAEEKNARLVEKNLKLQEAFAAMDKANRKAMGDHWQTILAMDELEKLYTISDMVALSKPDEVWARKEGQVKARDAHNWLYWQSRVAQGEKKTVVFKECETWCKERGLTVSYKTFQRHAINPLKDS